MLTQNELVQSRADFWKRYFLEKTSPDIQRAIGLVRCMTANAYQVYGESDDSGFYYASLLLEDVLQQLLSTTLTNEIGVVVDMAVKDAIDLADHQS